MEQMIDESPNAEIMVFINHEPTQDGQRTFARVGRTAPLKADVYDRNWPADEFR